MIQKTLSKISEQTITTNSDTIIIRETHNNDLLIKNNNPFFIEETTIINKVNKSQKFIENIKKIEIGEVFYSQFELISK